MTKKQFSGHWKGSSQRRKQRKYQAHAPLHIKQRFASAHLSDELKKKYGHRSLQIRKGDIVKIMRGEFKKKSGKVHQVMLKKTRIYIEGITRAKKDGTTAFIPLHPSNVMIITPVLEDKRRMPQQIKETKK